MGGLNHFPERLMHALCLVVFFHVGLLLFLCKHSSVINIIIHPSLT